VKGESEDSPNGYIREREGTSKEEREANQGASEWRRDNEIKIHKRE